VKWVQIHCVRLGYQLPADILIIATHFFLT